MRELELALTSNLCSLTISLETWKYFLSQGEVTLKITGMELWNAFCMKETTQSNNVNNCYEHKQ